MDISQQDNTQQPISDDQDLAKALAGVLPGDSDETGPDTLSSGLSFEETSGDASSSLPPIAPLTLPTDPSDELGIPAADPLPAPSSLPTPDLSALETATNELAPPVFGASTAGPATTLDNQGSKLEDIKLQALRELQPLMGKVDLPADEKFDTYLMLLRSSDDSSLIAPAHAAAQAISDEKRKAEALLEIIKEIDYLSRKDQPAA